MPITSLDAARFTPPEHRARICPGDDAAAVAALFACPACGTPARLVHIVGKPGARRAISGCVVCLTSTKRDLTDAESYVLWTMPRGDVFIQFADESL